MDETDLGWLRRSFDIARRSGARGDEPFGALLVDAAGALVLEAGNTVVTEGDCTGHAEINAVRAACRQLTRVELAGCTLYASTEPCAMCAAAIHWARIGRLVYGLSTSRFYELVGMDPTGPALRVTCRQVLAPDVSSIELLGPVLEDEAARAHEGFWARTP